MADSARKQILTAMLTRLQAISGIRKASRSLLDPDDVKAFPAAFLWAAREVKEPVSFNNTGGKKEVTLETLTRAIVKGSPDTVDLILEDFLKQIEDAYEAAPFNLGTGVTIIAVRVTEILLVTTSADLSGGIGMSDITTTVRYRQGHGVA